MRACTLLSILTTILISLTGIVSQDDLLDDDDPWRFVADAPGDWISGLPLSCNEGCFTPASVYYVCFMNTTLPENGGQADQDECNEYLCDPENYNHLRACLNCVVANGNERPYGYHTNSSLTAPATDALFGPAQVPVGGYIDSDRANGWLSNVTDRCSSIGSALEGVTATVTATPTTTGPYFTSWTSGVTVTFSIWEELTAYSDQFMPSDTPVFGPDATGSQTSGSSRGSGTNSGPTASPTGSASPTASAPAESSGAPNAASQLAVAGLLPALPALLGLVLW